MTEWCWLNGQTLPLADARVGVEDRGFQLADGVYEAIRVYQGKPFELLRHLNRLARSCEGIRLTLPISRDQLVSEMMKLVAHSQLLEGLIYLQVTRGEAPRNQLIPKNAKPTVLFYTRELPPVPGAGQGRGYTLLSTKDERWNKCWIKSLSLLENVLAKSAAADAGADEAIFIHEGKVMEGTTSNIFMVRKEKLITPPLGNRVLPGVTRDVLLECAKELGIAIEETALPLEEAQRCDEVFITSSTRELVWASKWDSTSIGNGSCGPVALRLHRAYRSRVTSA